MYKPDKGQIGEVAIHRWFSDGEGWAYHPWYESHMRELLTALKEELDTRRHLSSVGGCRFFTYPAIGGLLYGEQISDLDCPDEKASDRFPTILRAVFLRDTPSDPEKVRQNLSLVSAEKAGPDADLIIKLECTSIPCPKPKFRKGKLIFLLVMGIMGIIGIIFLAGYLLAWLHGHPKNPGKEEPRDELSEKMEKLLIGWGQKQIARGGKNQVLDLGKQFLGFLSQEKLRDRMKGNHPDVLFINRLPERGVAPRNLEELHQELERLLTKLSSGGDGRPALGGLTKTKKVRTTILEEIAQQMDYLQWWKSEGKHLLYATEAKADLEVARFACRFIDREKAYPGWQKPVAEAMVSVLSSWKVEAVTAEDVDKRPWFVFHCFFQFLSQKHFEPEDLRDDSKQAVFVGNLPKEPLTKNGLFTNEQELIGLLRQLAYMVGAKESQIATTLITNISKELDFEEWEKNNPGVRRVKVEGVPRVKQFVDRVRSKL